MGLSPAAFVFSDTETERSNIIISAFTLSPATFASVAASRSHSTSPPIRANNRSNPTQTRFLCTPGTWATTRSPKRFFSSPASWSLSDIIYLKAMNTAANTAPTKNPSIIFLTESLTTARSVNSLPGSGEASHTAYSSAFSCNLILNSETYCRLPFCHSSSSRFTVSYTDWLTETISCSPIASANS